MTILRHFGLAQCMLSSGQVFNTFTYGTSGMNCHGCAGTLDAGYVGRGEEVTVLDIDSIVHIDHGGA